MPKLRSKLVLAAIAFMVVPALILCAELFVRIFLPRVEPLSVFVASPQLRSDTQGENTSGMFEFDPLLTWRLKPGLRGVWWDFTPVSTNKAHLRMDAELAPKKGRRVVCMGDSVTFGYRVPVAHDRAKPGEYDASEKTYPMLLEAALRKASPWGEVDVIPLACPGYSTTQGLAWLQRDISTLQPDVVTACFGWNDVRAAGAPDRETMPKGAQAKVRGIIASSQLLLRMAQSAQQKKAPAFPPPPQPRSSEAEYLENIAAMEQLCRANGARFIVILPVYRDPNTPGDYPEAKEHPGDPEEAARMAAYRAALKREALAKGIPLLEIPELTEAGWPGNAGCFGERIHPNAAGHQLMAERLLPLVSKALAQ